MEIALAPLFVAAEAARDAVRRAKERSAPAAEIAGLNAMAEERMQAVAQAKAAEFVKLDIKAGQVIEGNGLRATLATAPRLRGRILEVDVLAFDAATGEPVPMDNPYGFVNPPMRVPDGTSRIEKDPVTDEDVEVDNFAENLGAAFAEILTQAVAGKARRLGWRG